MTYDDRQCKQGKKEQDALVSYFQSARVALSELPELASYIDALKALTFFGKYFFSLSSLNALRLLLWSATLELFTLQLEKHEQHARTHPENERRLWTSNGS